MGFKELEYFMDDQGIPFRIIITLDSGVKIPLEFAEYKAIFKRLLRLINYHDEFSKVRNDYYLARSMDEKTFNEKLKELPGKHQLKRYGTLT